MFEVITGSGHCGTMWLAAVLDAVPGRSWTHEARRTIAGLSWVEATTYPVDSPMFDSYWHSIRRRMIDYDIVGDSNSWPPESLPDVAEVTDIGRVIYLTRDKEAQLHSLLTASRVWSAPKLGEAALERLAMYATISGREPSIELLVEANDFMPDWLRGFGFNVDVYGLEELTTDVDKLAELAPLSSEVLRAFQGNKINQKVFDD
jgi:hypothetical protein